MIKDTRCVSNSISSRYLVRAVGGQRVEQCSRGTQEVVQQHLQRLHAGTQAAGHHQSAFPADSAEDLLLSRWFSRLLVTEEGTTAPCT